MTHRFPLTALFLSMLLLLSSCSGCPGRRNEESGSESMPESGSRITVESTGTEEEPPESETPESTGGKPGDDKQNSPVSEHTKDEDESGREDRDDSGKETDGSGSEDDSESTEEEKSTEETTAPPHVHSLSLVPGVFPTCTEAGHFEYYLCSGCGACYYDAGAARYIESPEEIVIPPAGHKLKLHPADVIDCNERGLIRPYYECEVCGLCFLDEAASERVEDLASLESDGSHQLSHVEEMLPTCRRIGVKEHWKCAICYHYFYDAEAKEEVENPDRDLIIPTLPHDLEKVEKKEPGCTEDGEEAHYCCKNCKELFLDEKAEKPVADKKELVIAAAGHKLVKTEKKEATKDAEGNEEYYTCSACGKMFSDPEGKDEITESDILIPRIEESLEETP